jgi:hypothetical protein
MRKTNENVFPLGLVDFLESRPKFIIVDQSAFYASLMPKTSNSIQISSILHKLRLPEMVRWHKRERPKISGRGTHVRMRKTERNNFPRGLVNFLESRSKFTILDQSAVHTPLISMLQTRSKSVINSIELRLPKCDAYRYRANKIYFQFLGVGTSARVDVWRVT